MNKFAALGSIGYYAHAILVSELMGEFKPRLTVRIHNEYPEGRHSFGYSSIHVYSEWYHSEELIILREPAVIINKEGKSLNLPLSKDVIYIILYLVSDNRKDFENHPCFPLNKEPSLILDAILKTLK